MLVPVLLRRLPWYCRLRRETEVRYRALLKLAEELRGCAGGGAVHQVEDCEPSVYNTMLNF